MSFAYSTITLSPGFRMRHLLALMIVAAAVGGFMFLKATRPAPPPVEVRERIWRVATVAAAPTRIAPTLTLYGRVEAPDRVRMAAPVAGRVLEVGVRDGAVVEAGAVLLRMDPRDLEPRLAQARADVEREGIRAHHDRLALAQERSLLGLAETKFERFDKLRTARLGADSAADQASEELARVRLAVTLREQAIAEQPARLAQVQAKLDEARRDLERSVVSAPFGARVGAVEVAAGDQVQAGQTLLTLYSAEGLYVRAKLPAIHAAELREAIAAGVGLAAVADFGSVRLPLVLERISGEADARGVDVLMRIEGGEGVPLGAFVNAELERPVVAGVLALPFAALHGGDRIYRVLEGRLQGVRVERLGERRIDGEPHLVVRASEIAEGDSIMVTHLPNAIDGLSVEAVTP